MKTPATARGIRTKTHEDKRVWCVRSLDRDDKGQVIGECWCAMERRVRGQRPRYRDHEKTSCCGETVVLPCGYEFREPSCDGS